MKQYNIKQLGLALSVIFFMSGCNENTITAESVAMNKIVEYSQYKEVAPTKEDYADAGVVGVDNEEKLAEINEIVEVLDVQEVDTPNEIQAFVNTIEANKKEMTVFSAVTSCPTASTSSCPTATTSACSTTSTTTCSTATKSTCPTPTTSTCPTTSTSTCPTPTTSTCPTSN